MATTEIVKSNFIVDPEDKFNLIRRTESGADLDREYWERVNQGAWEGREAGKQGGNREGLEA